MEGLPDSTPAAFNAASAAIFAISCGEPSFASLAASAAALPIKKAGSTRSAL